MIDVGPITAESVRYVLDHIWPRGEEELRLLGITKDESFAKMMEWARTGYKSSTLVYEGRPVVVCGYAGDEAFTWFQATDDFDKCAGDITRYLRQEARAFPGKSCVYSVCVHPQTAKWFRILGYLPTDFAETLPSGAVLRKFERE